MFCIKNFTAFFHVISNNKQLKFLHVPEHHKKKHIPPASQKNSDTLLRKEKKEDTSLPPNSNSNIPLPHPRVTHFQKTHFCRREKHNLVEKRKHFLDEKRIFGPKTHFRSKNAFLVQINGILAQKLKNNLLDI